MPLRLDVKRKLSARSDRVKCVDIHPSEPWLLGALYNGNVYIWNYSTQVVVKSFEVTELPVRSARFVVRKQWVIAGADDMFIRVYNYNTLEKVKTFEAHSDYIRCIAVHPTQPYVLSSSDDMLIKLWDWDKNWQNIQVFEGHTHYVMQIAFNPKDTNTFASASLDRTIKVWSLGSMQPNFTLEGHDKGVNCVDYYPGGDKPFLVSGADDKLVKIWDYTTKTCVQTLESHTHNVSAVSFHPELPIIISGSEDGTVRIWHSSTYRLESTLNYAMERVWAIGVLKGSNKLALGYDEGAIVIKIGREEPVSSMDPSGKVIWAKHTEVQTLNLRSVEESDIQDGERLPVSAKDLGSCEIFPQTMRHNSNGRFVVVCGDGEFIVYTALQFRNKTFGQALDFVWADDSGDYAVRESTSKIKTFKNFKEKKAFKPPFSAEGIFGGALLGVKGQDFICFYDWDECRVVRRIDVTPKHVYWSESGTLVVIACEQSFYILKYDRDIVARFFDSGAPIPEDGVDSAFDLVHEISDRVRTGRWVGDCFIYTTNTARVNYCVGGEVTTLYHLDRKMYLLGYLASANRLYLIDKEFSIVSYQLLQSVLEYKTAVVRRDFEAADKILPSVPQSEYNKIARFLESQGLKEQALHVATDPDFKFEIAVQLGRLEIAHKIALEAESEAKWKQLADLAVASANVGLAEECMTRAKDYAGLLLTYSARGDASGLTKLAQLAAAEGKNNIAFASWFILNRVEDCLDLLCTSGRIAEAAFMARTYLPSQVPRIVELWRQDLSQVNDKAAASLADPAQYPNLFSDYATALKAEAYQATLRSELLPADAYLAHAEDTSMDLIAETRALLDSGVDIPSAGATSNAAAQSAKAPALNGPSKAAAPTAATSAAAKAAASSSLEADLDDIDHMLECIGTGDADLTRIPGSSDGIVDLNSDEFDFLQDEIK